MLGVPKVPLLTSALDETSMFVVYAARLHQRQEQCLCPLFHAAGMCGSQALFMDLQDALSADMRAGFVAGARGSPVVTSHEYLLLAALSHWQRHPGDFSDYALELLAAPAVCRIAAPLAREFARRLARAGLKLSTPLPSLDVHPGSPATREMAAMH